MPPTYRLIEVSIYSVLNLLPLLAIALYPFRHRLRFSKGVTLIFIAGLTVIQVGLGLWAAFFSHGNAAMVSAVSTVLYASFYFAAVKMPVGKTLFTLLILSNQGNCIVILAKCIEGQLFCQLAIEPYRWSASLMLLLVEIIILVPIFFYIKISYTPAIEKEPSGLEWRYLWLIPATFYLIWYYCIYGNKYRTGLEIALQPGNAVFLFLINAGAFLIYFVVSKLVLEQEKNIKLEIKNSQLAMQALQYKNMQQKIAEARRAKHDVRHHITLMQEYLKQQQYQELEQYLCSYQKQLPYDSLSSFCENTTVNTILLYFAQLAKENSVDFSAEVSIGERMGIEETDLSVLFGNLLENALDACCEEPVDARKITIRGKFDGACLSLMVDNTYTNTIQKNRAGTYLSTKHAGVGQGIASALSIVERYNGTIKITQHDGTFCVFILMSSPVSPDLC